MCSGYSKQLWSLDIAPPLHYQEILPDYDCILNIFVSGTNDLSQRKVYQDDAYLSISEPTHVCFETRKVVIRFVGRSTK